MVEPRLLGPLAINLLGAALAIAVGVRLRARVPPGDAGRAIGRFSVWWIALGGYILLGQTATAAAVLGFTGTPVAATLLYASVLAMAVMLWGLVSYLVFLFTGRASVLRPITAFYAVQFVLGVAYVAWLHPVGLRVAEWTATPVYAGNPPAWGGLLYLVFFLLPPILGAFALGTAALRVRERTPRYRAAAVSIGILLWFIAAIVLNAVAAAGTSLNAVTALGGPALGVACLLLIVSAYMPPAWLRRRGIEPFGAREPSEARASAREEGRRAFEARARELI